MDDPPYTTPDEDPFTVHPLSPPRRPSSMLDKWINDQHSSSMHQRSHSSPSHAYLAYPELNRPSIYPVGSKEDFATASGYDLVDDDDIPPSIQLPNSSATVRFKRTTRLSLTPSAFRSFNMTFRSPSPIVATPDLDASPSPLPRDITTISPRSSQKPNQPSSCYSVSHTPSPKSTSSRWRPTVLGYFAHSATSESSLHPPSETNYTPSRPSISSSIDTNAHTLLTVPSTEGHPSPTPSSTSNHQQKHPSSMDTLRQNGPSRSSNYWSQRGDVVSGASLTSLNAPSTSDVFGSIRGASPSPTASSGRRQIPYYPRKFPYVYNNALDESPRKGMYHYHGSHGLEEEDPTSDASPLAKITSAPQDKKKPHVLYSSDKGSTLSRMTSFSNFSLSPLVPKNRRKRRKKLVVSNVAPNDVKKFEGVKRWCETFGEVRQITRLPNNDLVVTFKSAEVADTVCRVRARVTIGGVGSVLLSWEYQ